MPSTQLADFEDGQWQHEGDLQVLPRADDGKQAWMVLGACFCLEALVWGFPFAFGVFLDFHSTHEPFASQSSGIAAIGTTATGVMVRLKRKTSCETLADYAARRGVVLRQSNSRIYNAAMAALEATHHFCRDGNHCGRASRCVLL